MKSSRLSSSLFIIYLSLMLYVALPALSLNLYEIVCNEAGQDANSCMNILKTDSRIVAAKNYHDLSKFILEMAFSKATSVQSYYVKVGIRFPEDKAIRQCSLAFFADAMEDFESALYKLGYNPKGAIDDIHDAGNEVKRCEKALADEKSYNPSIHALNNGIYLLSEISFLAVNHFALKGGL
ncbi:unnamed protein product [Lathyrus sativus]|nr:unnamed protein product [Lathyrus sativus]